MTSNLTITPETLYPRELLYFRRMGSREITEFLAKTPPEKRLVLITWGVLEAHGPWLPVASDSMMAQVATDKVADLLYRNHHIQPIIFNAFVDLGSYSATRDFPGAVAIEGWEAYASGKNSPIARIWHEVIGRLKKEGFATFFLVNGDGGNWMNYFERPWEKGFKSLKDEIQQKHGVLFDGSNWDQEGGEPGRHAGTQEHALINWLCRYAPPFERLAALRAGMKPIPEEYLQTIDGTDYTFLEEEQGRRSNWAEIQKNTELRGVAEFSFAEYRKYLYEEDGVTPRTSGGIVANFTTKIENLMNKILALMR